MWLIVFLVDVMRFLIDELVLYKQSFFLMCFRAMTLLVRSWERHARFN